MAEIIAADLLNKMNQNGQNGQEAQQQSSQGEGPRGRPKGKAKEGKGGRQRRSGWPIWVKGISPIPPLLLSSQSSVVDPQVEAKFREVLYLQQRPLAPLQPQEMPSIQPPEFPVSVQADQPISVSSHGPYTQPIGPLLPQQHSIGQFIHVTPSFALLDGHLLSAEDEGLKHPFEEPFRR